MRTRSNSTEPEAVRLDLLPGHTARFAGRGWINGTFQKLFRIPRSQDSVNIITTTDGHVSPSRDEEPQIVILTFAQTLEEQLLSEASQLLIEREERLFGEVTEAAGPTSHEEEVNDLAADRKLLEDHILQTLLRSLSLNAGGTSAEALTSAVKAVCREDEQDQLWEQRDRRPPGFRPCGWKKLHDETLLSLVKERLENPSTNPTNQTTQSSLEADICNMGRQLMKDLHVVVDVVRTCYPPEFGICDFYARLYHQTFSARLRAISDFGLEDRDCTYLLRWVNEYYPGLFEKPELAREIDAEALGRLLSKDLLEPLEEQYLNNKQSELRTYISRVLDEANQMWNNGEEPTLEDGCYVSPVAYDIIQFINGMVTSAGKVVGDLHKAQSITCKLNGLMQSFKIFQDNVVKLNRANSQAIIKANLGCVQQFRDVLQKNGHLFREDVRKECLRVLTDMRDSAHSYLLSPVHKALRPRYQKLGTSEWLKNPLLDGLLVDIQSEVEKLQGAKKSCRQELICQLHEEVTVEYVRRLLKGEVKLRDREQQNKAQAAVMDNAQSLHKLFVELGSTEHWLREVLTQIAEVLKLQELPAIQTEVFSLGSAFPDLSEKHLSSLLKLKTNLSKGDRKTVYETLSDALRETSVAGSRPFFSKVQVKRCFTLAKR